MRKPPRLTATCLTVLGLVVSHGEVSAATIAARMGMYEVDGTSAPLRSLQRHGAITARREGRLLLWTATDTGHRLHREQHAASRPGEVAQPRHVNLHGPVWHPAPWRPEHARPGCMDHVRLPSLIGGQRVYRRDAEVVQQEAAPC